MVVCSVSFEVRLIYQIGITEINTQVRRLAYLSALISILGQKSITETLLFQRLEKWSVSAQQDLEHYRSVAGKIEPTKQHSGARRYTELLLGVGLGTRVAGAYRLTRFGKTILPFLNGSRKENRFELSGLEKIAYFYWLCATDSERLLTVMNMISDTPHAPISTLQAQFQDYYLDRINWRLKHCSEREARDLLLVRNRVTHQWKNPQRYAENIVPPRLHWLLDLGLVSLAKKPKSSPSLTQAGMNILRQFPPIPNSSLPDVDTSWLRKNYFSHVAPILTNSAGVHWSTLSKCVSRSIIEQAVTIPFKVLRTSQAPVVTLLPALMIIAYELASRADPIWADLDELQDYIAELDHYEVRQSRRDNESYLLAHH
jgi:hypothetical protein